MQKVKVALCPQKSVDYWGNRWYSNDTDSDTETLPAAKITQTSLKTSKKFLTNREQRVIINRLSRRADTVEDNLKKVFKKLQKTLDKQKRMSYNKRAVKDSEQDLEN